MSAKTLFWRLLRRKLVRKLTWARLSERTIFAWLSVIVGLIGGAGGVAFKRAILASEHLYFDIVKGYLEGFLGKFALLLLPAIGGLLVGPMVYFWAREARGHGVPEVMEAVALRGGRMRLRTAFAKLVTAAITIGSGGSAGGEGPIVQIGSSLGSAIAQLFRLSDERIKGLVACGAAAGISAVFSAPIAGVFFGLEVILGDFSTWSFAFLVLASVSGNVVWRLFFGEKPLLGPLNYGVLGYHELIFYAILGAIAGIVATFYIKAFYFIEDRFDELRLPTYLKPAFGGLLVGAIGVGLPQVMGAGYSNIQDIITSPQNAIMLLLIIALCKIFATSFTLGSGGSGGVFAPALFMGGAIGSAFGGLLKMAFPNLVGAQQSYAIVGMGALAAGALNAPITLIIMVFEMTGDYAVILPVMVATVVSVLVARRLSPLSIYTHKLAKRGIQLVQGRALDVFEDLSVRDAMSRDVNVVDAHTPLVEVLRIFRDSPNLREVFVLDGEGKLCGMIGFQDLKAVLFEMGDLRHLVAHDILTEDIPTLNPDDPLPEAIAKLGIREHAVLPVVEDGKIVGILRKEDIADIYNRLTLQTHGQSAREDGE